MVNYKVVVAHTGGQWMVRVSGQSMVRRGFVSEYQYSTGEIRGEEGPPPAARSIFTNTTWYFKQTIFSTGSLAYKYM